MDQKPSIPAPKGELLYPYQVAAIMRVSPKTVNGWARRGKLPSIRTLGGHRRFYRADVDALLRGESR